MDAMDGWFTISKRAEREIIIWSGEFFFKKFNAIEWIENAAKNKFFINSVFLSLFFFKVQDFLQHKKEIDICKKYLLHYWVGIKCKLNRYHHLRLRQQPTAAIHLHLTYLRFLFSTCSHTHNKKFHENFSSLFFFCLIIRKLQTQIATKHEHNNYLIFSPFALHSSALSALLVVVVVLCIILYVLLLFMQFSDI